ncbi:hypothetical protein QBC38DRAFT_518148 [Podospora fimiseda]|uniref:Uncharacterized protein n=1 Tax=Podospora fimiseda TaxID=252190 RepID=A0AAN6YQ52_9PEZI|nr:hypothetical protein QBC38DRAFT_518148 [Podospora fimiseda]
MATTTSTTLKPIPEYPKVPLTTTFTPPPDCQYNGVPTMPVSGLLYVNDIATHRSNMPPAYSCYPPGFPSAIYSPGLCPSGLVAWSGHPDYSHWSTEYTEILLPREHKALCCHSGFEPDDYQYFGTPSCQRIISHTQATDHTGYVSHTITVLAYDKSRSSYFTSSEVDTFIMVQHPGVVIRWRDGDFPDGVDPAPPIPKTSTRTRTKTSSIATPTAVAATEDKELSTGAKAGIGIGAGIAVILIGLGVFILWSYWRRRGVSNKENVELQEQLPEAI